MASFNDIMQDLFNRMCDDPNVHSLYVEDNDFDTIVEYLFIYGPGKIMNSFSYNGPFGVVEIIRGHERVTIGYEDAAEFF